MTLRVTILASPSLKKKYSLKNHKIYSSKAGQDATRRAVRILLVKIKRTQNWIQSERQRTTTRHADPSLARRRRPFCRDIVDECSRGPAFTGPRVQWTRRKKAPAATPTEKQKGRREIAGRLSRDIRESFARPCRRFFTPFLPPSAPRSFLFLSLSLSRFFSRLANANQKGL